MVYTLGLTALLAAIPTVLGATYHVSVGANGNLAYNPKYVHAKRGDVVKFLFHPKNHTVTQSAFPHGDPCSTKTGHALDSGFQFVAPGAKPSTFKVKVKDDKPVWFYCQQTAPKSHCAAGMVFAINPPAHGKNTFHAFESQAKKSTIQSKPKSEHHKSKNSHKGQGHGRNHTIIVGVDGKLEYGRNNIHAKVGDHVIFSFRQKNHTVTQSSFENPCTGIDKGFKSGFVPVAQDLKDNFPTFVVKIENDKPIWGYCGQKAPVSHCGAGMVFGINAPKHGNTFEKFLAAAKKQATPVADNNNEHKGSKNDHKNNDSSKHGHRSKKHIIVVGIDGKLAYGHNNIHAKVGDIVEFSFRQKNHTVTQSSFENPCTGIDKGFKSGFVPVAQDVKENFPTFEIKIHDDKPIWGYCGQKAPVSHCGAGMVFAINAPKHGNTFEKFLDLAKKQATPVADNKPDAKNHTIVVGVDGQLAYGPNLLKASIGDTVIFSFRQKNHTVTQSSFENPCTGIDGGFKSGFVPVAADLKDNFPTFEITIKDDKPIWGYCGQKLPVSHCGAGMVFGINAPDSGNTFDKFQATAKATAAKVNLAGAVENEESNDSTSSVDFKSLMRNAYIIIGLLGAVVLMIIVLIVVVITKGKRSGSKYSPVVVAGPSVPVFDASKPYSTPY